MLGLGSLVVSPLVGSPFIATCQRINQYLGAGGGGVVVVYWLCWQKCWYAGQGRGGCGCDVLVCHKTIESRLRYALFVVENVHTSPFELVMYLSYYCSLKS